MKNYRCPICADAHRAPERMRKDNTLRYCLGCSKKTGKLVEMICPSKEDEKKRAEDRKKARELKAKEHDAARSAAYSQTERGRLETYARKWLNLKAFKEGSAWARLHEPWKQIDIKIRLAGEYTINGETRRQTGTSGHAYGSFRFVITAGSDWVDALTTILHEIAHCAAGYTGGPHGDGWKSVFSSAVFEVTGIRASGGTHGELHAECKKAIGLWLQLGAP